MKQVARAGRVIVDGRVKFEVVAVVAAKGAEPATARILDPKGFAPGAKLDEATEGHVVGVGDFDEDANDDVSVDAAAEDVDAGGEKAEGDDFRSAHGVIL